MIKTKKVVKKVIKADDDFPKSLETTSIKPTMIGSHTKILSIG